MEAGDRTGGGLDSPRYHLGPQTQAIGFETVNKLCKEAERKKMFDFSDIPSFSLGLTQDEHDIGPETQKEVANTSEKGLKAFSSGNSESSFSSDMEENRVKARQESLDVVPLNFFSPKNEVMVRGRRAVTLTERMKSPFYIRIVNADKVESSEEKRLANILFKKMARDVSEVLFKTKYGHQSSRGQIETLGPQEPVDDNVVSSWSAYLNFMEEKKDSISPTRLFFPTFEVDKKLFACDNAYTLEMFMEYAENANSSYAGQAMLEKADINPAVTLNDSKKEGKKVTRKKKKDDDIDDVRIASKLHLIFGQYLYAINHGKAAAILECQLVRGNFAWQTNRRAKDCGIFLMRHMESYIGSDIGKWKCGLDVEGKKQNTQLGRLRNKYAAKLLLANCNIFKGYLKNRIYEVILMVVVVRICYEPRSIIQDYFRPLCVDNLAPKVVLPRSQSGYAFLFCKCLADYQACLGRDQCKFRYRVMTVVASGFNGRKGQREHGSSLKRILDDTCADVESGSSDFGVMVAALKVV
ncbi:hypothetical protein Tco_0565710 [Tanacetum coccineum]